MNRRQFLNRSGAALAVGGLSFALPTRLMASPDLDPVERPVLLVGNLHNRLTENRLADNQSMVQSSDGKWDLNCTLRDTQGLRLFLLSNADEIEVLGPPVIRAHVRDALRRAVIFYADD